MENYYPYLNRGTYKWVPDSYASTSASSFGVTDAYDFAVCNYGRHFNMLAGEDAPHAFGTTVVCKGITDGQGGLLNSLTPIVYKPSGLTPSPIKAPFERKIRRGTNADLNNIPFPPVTGGFGFRYENVNDNPFFFFSTLDLSTGGNLQNKSGIGTGRIASVDIEYMLATSKLWEEAKDTSGNPAHIETNPPLTILAVIDDSLMVEDETWLTTTRTLSQTTDDKGNVITTTWGPAEDQIAADGHTQAALNEVALAIGSGPLKAIFLPMYTYVDGASPSAYPELAINNQAAYDGVNLDWSITARRTINIKLSGSYWINLEYFPKIAGFIIMPNWRIFPGNQPMNPQVPLNPWNAIISGIRVYDALQTNATPEHIKTTVKNGITTTETVTSQLPCEIFGYVWRISHPVTMSSTTKAIQPTRGGTEYGSGLGDRVSTFYFKIYHPDIDGLGIAHGVRFYYTLVVLAIPGTSPLAATGSLIGLLGSLATDSDLLFVQYMGIRPGSQSLTFQFGLSQYGSNIGKNVYSGIYAFARDTIGVRCGWALGSPTSPPSSITVNNLKWLPLDDALPKTLTNGTKVLFYDNNEKDPETDIQYNANNKWYTFASVDAFGVQQFDPTSFATTYIGGLTPLAKGAPQTNIPGPGAFGMSVSSSSSFIGPEKITVYAKPRQYAYTNTIADICSDNNNHLATFVSEVRNIGPDVQTYTGTWRLKIAAATGSTLRMNSQIFFRFFFIPEKYNGETTDLTNLNGTALLQQPQLFEFHFRSDQGNYVITPGAPSISSVIATPVLSEQVTSYDLSWQADYGEVGNYVSEVNPQDLFQKQIVLHLGRAMPLMEGTRLIVQAWAANFPVDVNISGVSDYYKPEEDLNYPAVEMSWSGETESMFQTMIIETKSDAILAQQDPYVSGTVVESFDYITTSASQESEESKKAQKAKMEAEARGEVYIPPPFRYYPLWSNQLSFSNGKLKPLSDGVGGYSTLKQFGLLTYFTTPVVDGGRASLTDFTVPEVSDLTEDQVQIADLAINVEGGLSSAVGGTTIGPTEFIVNFAYLTNKSNYNVRYLVELLAVSSNSITTYLIARSGLQYIDTTSNIDETLQFSGFASFSMVVNSSLLIPDTNAKLMLRFKFWPNKNRVLSVDVGAAIAAVSADSENDFNPGFTCIDISSFNITMNPFAGLNNSGTSSIDIVTRALQQRGSSDWYEGLPLTTSRTFGSPDYYFVADEDSLKTSIMPPLTMSGYGYWYLYGWLFSPFWFLQMPDGACIEIKDDAGLTAGNAVTGTNFSARERAQRVLMFRTAVGTLPLANVSADMENAKMSGKGMLARQRIEVSGAASASNFLSVIQGVQSSKSLDHGVLETAVNSGSSIISGKNPLIISGSPTRKREQSFYRGNVSTTYLFYEEDTFDIDTHSSVVMLANYDGTLVNWNNPYGKRGSGSIDKTVFTNDMRLIGASVDPMDFSIYLTGFRANNLSNPSEGGTIMLKKMHPGLVFGIDSAHVGPLMIVDGLVTKETYNVRALADVQPVVPTDLIDGSNPYNRLNTLADGGKPLPVAESFPDVIVDSNGLVYVFYTFLTNTGNEAKRALGKIYCRQSHNAGYWFDTPFPIADLGYERALASVSMEANDESFQAKHVVAVYSDETKTYCLFFWANSKIFMRILPHPGIDMDRFKVLTPNTSGDPQSVAYSDAINMLYMIEGDTSFTDGRVSSALEQWLKIQWDMGDGMTDGDRIAASQQKENEQWYSSGSSASGKQNNFKPREVNRDKNTGEIIVPSIQILKYANASDVPAQRIGAIVNTDGTIIVYYLNSIGDVVYKQIRIFGQGPLITPGLTVSVNTL